MLNVTRMSHYFPEKSRVISFPFEILGLTTDRHKRYKLAEGGYTVEEGMLHSKQREQQLTMEKPSARS